MTTSVVLHFFSFLLLLEHDCSNQANLISLIRLIRISYSRESKHNKHITLTGYSYLINVHQIMWHISLAKLKKKKLGLMYNGFGNMK